MMTVRTSETQTIQPASMHYYHPGTGSTSTYFHYLMNISTNIFM